MSRTPLKRQAIDEADPAAVEVLSSDDLKSRLGFHMRMAQTAMQRDFLAALKELDLSQKLCAVLTLLSEHPGSSQIDLANALVTDRATMMAIIDRLQDRHLLYRVRSKTDRRRQDLFLTETGAETLARANALIMGHEKHFSARFSKAELAMLTELLLRIYQD